MSCGLSTGSTLLNLALTGSPDYGLLEGHYYLLVGDSAAGKTFLAMSCFAEAARVRHFRKHRYVYDDVEGGCMMDLPRLFGSRMARKVEPPGRDDGGEPMYSSTIEEFYYHVDDAIGGERPVIYVVDSMDGLTSEAAEDKFDSQKEAYRRGRDVAGSYGDGKAKINSQNLRTVIGRIGKTGSILIILSQTRDNLGFGFERKTRSGGRALRFYASVELWMKIVSRLKKTIGGRERELGVRVACDVMKNRITGKLRSVELDIYPSYGIDDTGSVVDWLVEERVWKKEKGKQTIVASDFDLSATREKLISLIEEKRLQSKLREYAGQVWARIEAECALRRAPKYPETV